ncbi:type VII secretion protein EccB [Streptomyces dangxiongensis]|uniref:Type VII secretion protein EccB n=1 Tax=Streptomyces dangxiongensis TaxID=1442032 RepID=A0A3G2JLA1_9ACTN|nr:type VII secretion protein EccB [Streptomyces dangxiongensis]AYN43210.1 type VII secretion protein EccB [Streptomyces dangxiongensis]
MQSRRDHVHAYQFATGRLAAALVTGEPATGEPPARRSVLGVVLGLLLAVLACAGFAVYGLIKPGGNTAWARPNAIVVEKETGTRFLYVDGVLHPVANYASALLGAAGGGGGTAVHTVSSNSLSGVRRGTEIGIPAAPDSVPQSAALLTGDWTRCLTPGRNKGETLDFAPAGAPSAPRAPVTGRRALLRAADGTEYLLWNGVRYRLGDRSTIALQLDGQDPLPAPGSWLAALPAGPTVDAADVPGRGKEGPRVGDRPARVGDVFTSGADGKGVAQFYVLRSDGLAPLTRTEYELLATSKGAAEPREVTPRDVAAVGGSADRSLLHRLPDFLAGPVLRPGASAVCLRQHVTGATRVHTAVTLEKRPAATAPPVDVPVGQGLLVQALPLPPRGVTPQVYLVTELGVKYPLADQDTLSALGFGGGQARAVPRDVLDLLPTGPALSRTGALAAAPVYAPATPAPSATASKGR